MTCEETCNSGPGTAFNPQRASGSSPSILFEGASMTDFDGGVSKSCTNQKAISDRSRFAANSDLPDSSDLVKYSDISRCSRTSRSFLTPFPPSPSGGGSMCHSCSDAATVIFPGESLVGRMVHRLREWRCSVLVGLNLPGECPGTAATVIPKPAPLATETKAKGKLSASALFVTAQMAAVTAGAVTHPIDVVKVRMQLQAAGAHRGPFSILSDMIRNEGAGALSKGMSANLLRQCTFVGTKFGTYDLLKRTFGGSEKSGLAQQLAFGLAAGACGALVGTPADLVMVRMQADGLLPKHLQRNYRNAAQAVVQVSREEGIPALWRGGLPTVYRAMIVTAAQMACYDQVKETLIASSGGILRDGPLTHLSASVCAGVVASLASNPLDVTKTRLMQMQPCPSTGAMPYRGSFHCLITTVRTEGILALYKGLVPTIARQVPLNIIRFMCVEQFRKLLQRFM